MERLILYPGRELHLRHGETVKKIRIRKLYSTYALCQVGKKVDVISFREMMEDAEEAKEESTETDDE